ncbi:MAG: PilN domain-containing protein [Acidobacteriota bacterium]|nr:PilN domain-containing protein [Acidobacteriota bacterium]
MIKVNLLNSVTDKQTGVAAIETRVANSRAQGKLLLLAVGALAALAAGFHWMNANAAHQQAQQDLQREQETARQMTEIKKEIDDLSKKTEAVQTRIGAIKQLRASQQGPVAVLSSINARLPAIASFHLTGIEQKDGQITITGDSPSEAAVTQFGRSLEFSSGLFTDMSIEIERKPLEYAKDTKNAQPAGAEPVKKIETVSFKLKCKYNAPTPPVAGASGSDSAKQVAQK